jgi:hypothetical protein
LEDFALEPLATGHAMGLRVLHAIARPETCAPAMKRRCSIIREKLGAEVVARIDKRTGSPEGDRQ